MYWTTHSPYLSKLHKKIDEIEVKRFVISIQKTGSLNFVGVAILD